MLIKSFNIASGGWLVRTAEDEVKFVFDNKPDASLKLLAKLILEKGFYKLVGLD